MQWVETASVEYHRPRETTELTEGGWRDEQARRRRLLLEEEHQLPRGDLLRKYHTRNEKECHGWGTLVLTRDTALDSSAPGTACTAHAAGSVVHRMEIVEQIELTTTLRS
jgi:hypothetical protein